jgi:hypothetical protein
MALPFTPQEQDMMNRLKGMQVQPQVQTQAQPSQPNTLGDQLAQQASTVNTLQQTPVGISDPQKEIIGQAYQAAISPMQQSFQERLGTTVEDLSRRGIAFGGVGSEALGDLLQEQARVEGQIAQSLGAQLGSQALESQQRQMEANIARQEGRKEDLVRLALSGNLRDPEQAMRAVEEVFGPGYQLTPEDEVDLIRVASASGLSPEDFNRMKEAIGQGQLAAVLRNPNDFIQDPERARQFQIELAKIEAQAQREAAEAAADSGGFLGLGDIDLGIGGIGGSLFGGGGITGLGF